MMGNDLKLISQVMDELSQEILGVGSLRGALLIPVSLETYSFDIKVGKKSKSFHASNATKKQIKLFQEEGFTDFRFAVEPRKMYKGVKISGFLYATQKLDNGAEQFIAVMPPGRQESKMAFFEEVYDLINRKKLI